MRRWLVRQLMPAKQLELLTFDATAAASHRAAPYAPLPATALSPAAWFMLCNNAMGHEMQYVTWNVGRTAILFRFKRANTRVYYKDHAELFLCCIYRGYSRWEDICRPTWCGAACFFFFFCTLTCICEVRLLLYIYVRVWVIIMCRLKLHSSQNFCFHFQFAYFIQVRVLWLVLAVGGQCNVQPSRLSTLDTHTERLGACTSILVKWLVVEDGFAVEQDDHPRRVYAQL